jgi:Double zinc ribbon
MTLPCLLSNSIRKKNRMQFDANPEPVRTTPVPGQAGSSIEGDLDLYDELLAFAEMSPEAQELYLAGTASVTKSVNQDLEAQQPSPPEPAEPEAVYSIDCERASSPVECSTVATDSTPLYEESEVTHNVVQSSASDPLVDLNLDGGFTRVLSGKDCLACGAESDADDLFCMSCGSFLNGVASAAPSNPLCADCSQSISVDEIFCPWCGSVLAGG